VSNVQKYKDSLFKILDNVITYYIKKGTSLKNRNRYLTQVTDNNSLNALNKEIKNFNLLFGKSIESIVYASILENNRATQETIFSSVGYEILIKPLDPINFINDFNLYQNSTILKENYLDYLKQNFNNNPTIDIDKEIQNQIKSPSQVKLMTPEKFDFLDYFQTRNSTLQVYIEAFDVIKEFFLIYLLNPPVYDLYRLHMVLTTYTNNPLFTDNKLFNNSTSQYYSLNFYDNKGVKLNLSYGLNNKITHYIPLEVQDTLINNYIKSNKLKYQLNPPDYSKFISMPYVINPDCSINRTLTREQRLEEYHKKYTLTLNLYDQATDSYKMKKTSWVVGIKNNFIIAKSDLQSGNFICLWENNPANYQLAKNYYYLNESSTLFYCLDSYLFNSCFFSVLVIGIIYIVWFVFASILHKRFDNDDDTIRYIFERLILDGCTKFGVTDLSPKYVDKITDDLKTNDKIFPKNNSINTNNIIEREFSEDIDKRESYIEKPKNIRNGGDMNKIDINLKIKEQNIQLQNDVIVSNQAPIITEELAIIQNNEGIENKENNESNEIIENKENNENSENGKIKTTIYYNGTSEINSKIMYIIILIRSRKRIIQFT